MSSYVMRWCKNHGDWEEDVDNPEEACPECVAQGWTIPREKLLEENADLKLQLDNLAESVLAFNANSSFDNIDAWKRCVKLAKAVRDGEQG